MIVLDLPITEKQLREQNGKFQFVHNGVMRTWEVVNYNLADCKAKTIGNTPDLRQGMAVFKYKK